MIKNYLSVALRTLQKQTGYAAINVIGLAVGLACCLLIVLYVRSEWTHDAFHEHAEAIYRVNAAWQAEGERVRWSDTPVPLASALAATFPEIEYATPLYPTVTTIQHDRQTDYGAVTFVDASFFDLFSFPFVAGDASTAFPHPNAVVLTEEVARQFFGDTDPVGQQLFIKLRAGFEPFTVTAVLAEPPENSSLYFSILLPVEGIERSEYGEGLLSRWHSQAATFVRLRPSTSPKALEAKLPLLVNRYREALHQNREGVAFTLQPLTDIYFDQSLSTRGITHSSDPTYSYILLTVGLLILLIACINFTTISVAQSARRVKEVGVRKVLGAARLRLARQFLGEALMTACLAMLLGVALTELFLPTFNGFVDRTLTIQYSVSTGLILVGLMLGTGLVAGSYPALYLSRLRPGLLLQGRAVTRNRHTLIHLLVLAQFTVSIGLLTGTLAMSRQLAFMARYDLGMTPKDVVVVEPDFTSAQTQPRLYATLRAERPTRAGIQQVARSSGMIGRSYNTLTLEAANREVDAYQWFVTPAYLDVLGLTVLEGQAFEDETTHGVLVNETLVEALGWAPGTALGRPLFDGIPVAGVVADFHFRSLRSRIQPLVLRPMPADFPGGYLIARLDPAHRAEALARLQQQWTYVASDAPFGYHFLDDELAGSYAGEARWRQVFSYAAGFAIFIACLGLLGLSALTTARRTKEVGIRKVMGASVPDIVLLLSKSFFVLVGTAALLAFPFSYVLMQQWLDDFAYRIDLSWPIFLVAGLTALGAAILAVSYQAIRAALDDPVKSLRYE